MIRFGLALSLLLPAVLLSEEVPKALPVDPSEITPDTGPAVAEVAPSHAEARPLPAGEVKLNIKRSPNSDAPKDIDHLPEGEDAVRLQIFLDEQRFGPGVIDGKPGRFTILAVNSWNESHGYPPNDLTAAMDGATRTVTQPFALATIPSAAAKWVNPKLPESRELQAKEKRMSYRSYAEFMSERYHTDVEFLQQLNPGVNVWNLAPGKALIVPNVTPFLIENLNGGRYEPEPILASRHVVIDTKINQARVYESEPTAIVVEERPDGSIRTKPNKALVAAFPITPGQEKFIKYGKWEMKNAVQLPVWRYDKSLLETGKRSNNAFNIPGGPNCPVGVVWMGLSVPGIGMHGTSDPETIGRARSAGCIRLANWDVVALTDFVRPGASVEIR
ncbi:lipoprotein-anchoring transpeptidase ErfK/SrfK [Haloferula luteola]|uniref:Lipoprotein-anchoring transpeptidase ErfK/SrfK n=1 Tax=Haloferula luteola TaxID=595692 RepID=A0A840UZI9_9BACT|nr:L,D-transpeptidase [Haloferula luteola]MBB5350246.1 lipoprotein-anchoring transpeptidase ErfK/SrfK [Haloferula luteola]